MIHLVTDSTSDFTPAECKSLGVRSVPLTVRFGDEQFRDGIDLSTDDFYRRLTSDGVFPTTSQPSPDAFTTIYRELLATPGDVVLSIHISAKLSGTLPSASLAAQDFDGRVTVFDSQSVSAGLQHSVRTAARMVSDGFDTAEIVEALESRRDVSRIYVLLDTLTYLHRGGRIGGAAAFLGGVLGVKPVIQIRDGVVQPHSRVRSHSKGLAALVDLVNDAGPLAALTVVYSTTPDVAANIAGQLQTSHPALAVHAAQVGPVVGTYAGPGAIGVAVVED